MEWKQNTASGEATKIEMTEPMGPRLPRVKITVHTAKNLEKKCFIKIQIGNAPTCQTTVAKAAAVWNEEFVMRLEQGTNPFLCTIQAFASKTVGDSPCGGISVDLGQDLCMRNQGDTRRWNYTLDGGAEVTITFTALTPLQFPAMLMHNVEGMTSTVSLPYKPQPEVQFTIYQAIRLRGENKIIHKTPDVVAPNGERSTVILKTELIQGLSPFWGDKVRATIYTAQDSFIFQMNYQNGRRGKQNTEKACRLVLDDIKKLATATESRRWYAFMGNFLGGCLGVGFCAVSNMAALKSFTNVAPLNGVNVPIETTALSIAELKARAQTINPNASSLAGQRPTLIPLAEAQARKSNSTSILTPPLPRKDATSPTNYSALPPTPQNAPALPPRDDGPPLPPQNSGIPNRPAAPPPRPVSLSPAALNRSFTTSSIPPQLPPQSPSQAQSSQRPVIPTRPTSTGSLTSLDSAPLLPLQNQSGYGDNFGSNPGEGLINNYYPDPDFDYDHPYCGDSDRPACDDLNNFDNLCGDNFNQPPIFEDGYDFEEDDPFLRPLYDENGQQVVDELGRPMFRPGKPLYDDMGRMLYDENGQPLYDDEVRLLYDENGRMLYDEHGNPLFEDIIASNYSEYSQEKHDVGYFDESDYPSPMTPQYSSISPLSSPRGNFGAVPPKLQQPTISSTLFRTPTTVTTPTPTPVPVPAAPNYNDIFESIIGDTQENNIDTGAATIVSTQRVPDSPHVRSLLSLLNPMIPSWYNLNSNQKISWRQSQRLQAFNYLVNAQQDLTEQLSRLEEETTKQIDTTYDANDWSSRANRRRTVLLTELQDMSSMTLILFSSHKPGVWSLMAQPATGSNSANSFSSNNGLNSDPYDFDMSNDLLSVDQFNLSLDSGLIDIESIVESSREQKKPVDVPPPSVSIPEPAPEPKPELASTARSAGRGEPRRGPPGASGPGGGGRGAGGPKPPPPGPPPPGPPSVSSPVPSLTDDPASEEYKDADKEDDEEERQLQIRRQRQQQQQMQKLAEPATTPTPTPAVPTAIPRTTPDPATAPKPTRTPAPTTSPRAGTKSPASELSTEGEEQVKCILCKNSFPKSQTTMLRNKPFCVSCGDRMKKSAAAKGVKT